MTTNETNSTKQSWKRPWTLNEIVKSSTEWSLAADAGVCELLKKLSTDLINDINQVNNNVSEYALESKDTNVRIQNTFNDLCMLANDQFMESLVEDVGSTISDKTFALSEMTNASNSQQIKEDKLREAENQISLSLKFGMEVLDSQFELLDVTKLVSASRASGDDDDYDNVDPISRPVSISNVDFTTNDPIYHPKDPYENRHLPHIIGTSSFIEDDSLGIGYLDDQEMEEEEEEELSDDNMLHDHDATSMANLDSLSTISGDETKSIEIKIPNVDNRIQSDFMSDDDIFAEAKTEDDIDDILNTQDEEYDNGMIPGEEPVKRELTMADRLHDQLKKKFNEQTNDSLSQSSQGSSSLNQKRKSEYSNSKVQNNENSVFSTEHVDDDYDPFNDIIIPNKESKTSKATKSNTATTTSLTASSIASTKQQTIDSHTNLPKEAPKNMKTSLLSQNQFNSDDEEDDDDDFLFQDRPLPKLNRVIKSLKQEKSTSYGSSNLFSDDEDDYDLFATRAKPRISVPVTNSSKLNDKTKVNLKFPDKVVTEPKDMFTKEPVKEPDTKQTKSEIVGSKETNSKRLTKKFIPSDDSDDDFFREISSIKSSQPKKNTVQSSSTIVDQTTSKTLDKEEDTLNSLFNEYATVKPKTKKQDNEDKPIINKQDSISNFEDDSSHSQKIKSENSATYSVDKEGKGDGLPGLISSFDGDISGGKSDITHNLAQSQKNNAGSAGNYFNDNLEQKPVEVSQERPSVKKPPVGGFSMFPGGMHQHLDLLGEMKRKSQFKSTQQEKEEVVVENKVEDKTIKQNDCVEHTDEKKIPNINSLGFPIIRSSIMNTHNSGNLAMDGDEVGLDIDTPIRNQPRLTNLTKSRPRGNPKRKPTFKKSNSSNTGNSATAEDLYQDKKPDLSDDLTNNLSAKSETENSNSTDLFASNEDTKTPENTNIETTNKLSSIHNNELDKKPLNIKVATDVFGDIDDDDTEDLFSNLPVQTDSKSKKLVSDKSKNKNVTIANDDDDNDDDDIFNNLPLERKPKSVKQNVDKDTNKNDDALTVNVNDVDNDDKLNHVPLETKQNVNKDKNINNGSITVNDDDDDEDIFNNLPSETKSASKNENADINNKNNNNADNNTNDDDKDEDIFNNLPSETKSASKNENADINNKNSNNADNNTNDDDDDIFSNLPVPLEKKSNSKKKVTKKAVKTKVDVEEIDDIFAIPSSSSKKKPLKKKSSKISKDPLGAI